MKVKGDDIMVGTHPGQVADGGDLLLDTRRHLQPLLLHLLPQLVDAVLCAYALFLRADGANDNSGSVSSLGPPT